MRALVTGSAGFVGRHMTAELLRRGWDVTAVDIAPGRYGWQSELTAWLREGKSVYDLVVHAAAWTPHRQAIDSSPQMHLNNAVLDAELFSWAARTGQGRVLYFSSCAVLDERPDAYGETKLMGERLAKYTRTLGVPVTVVRPFSGYGEDQSEDFPFRAFVERAKRQEDPFVIWGSGRQVRDFIHIDDVVTESLMAVECGTEDPVSLCTGIGTSMAELAALVCAEAGHRPKFKTVGGNQAALRRVGVPAFRRPKISIAEGVRRAFRE
ncbi:MAG: NAD-dependent epimerase/dehydratase family protein [Labedaea sp.]